MIKLSDLNRIVLLGLTIIGPISCAFKKDGETPLSSPTTNKAIHSGSIESSPQLDSDGDFIVDSVELSV